jgi:hypothetical protein
MRHGAVHTLSLVGVILAPKSGLRFRLLYWLVAADSSGFDLLMMSPRQRMIIHEVHSPNTSYSTHFPPYASGGDNVGSLGIHGEVSTRKGSSNSNGDRGRLDGRQIQGLADRSHEGEGQYRLYGTDQFTCHPQAAGAPRGWASPPRATLNTIAAPHNMKQRQRNWMVYNRKGRQLVHYFFPSRETGMTSTGNTGRAHIMQSRGKQLVERT